MKPKILIFIDWFTPAFKAGGPIKSVSNIVNTLYNDFDFYIITSDRDINTVKPFENITFNRWVKENHYSIIYLTPDKRDNWIKSHIKEYDYDCYYLNSFFSKNYTIKPLLILNKFRSKKVIVAPRGMLGEASLAIKPIKKKIFIKLAKFLGYYKNVVWHATSEDEVKNIIFQFGSTSNINTAANISNCNIEKQTIVKESGKLNLVFFSRISPIKNLHLALHILKDLKNVSLAIYGTLEDQDYWKECLSIIKENNLNAHYKGLIIPKNVLSTLSKYHFLLLPTSHENYGHAIVEALTAGCGIIISDNTPWRNLTEKKIGWDINLDDKTKFIDTLKHCVKMEQGEYNSIRNNCYNFVEHEINNGREIVDTKNLFKIN